MIRGADLRTGVQLAGYPNDSKEMPPLLRSPELCPLRPLPPPGLLGGLASALGAGALVHLLAGAGTLMLLCMAGVSIYSI